MYGLAIAVFVVGVLMAIFALAGVVINHADRCYGWMAFSVVSVVVAIVMATWGAVTVTDQERQVCEKRGGSWELMQCYPAIHVEVE